MSHHSHLRAHGYLQLHRGPRSQLSRDTPRLKPSYGRSRRSRLHTLLPGIKRTTRATCEKRAPLSRAPTQRSSAARESGSTRASAAERRHRVRRRHGSVVGFGAHHLRNKREWHTREKKARVAFAWSGGLVNTPAGSCSWPHAGRQLLVRAWHLTFA